LFADNIEGYFIINHNYKLFLTYND